MCISKLGNLGISMRSYSPLGTHRLRSYHAHCPLGTRIPSQYRLKSIYVHWVLGYPRPNAKTRVVSIGYPNTQQAQRNPGTQFSRDIFLNFF